MENLYRNYLGSRTYRKQYLTDTCSSLVEALNFSKTYKQFYNDSKY